MKTPSWAFVLYLSFWGGIAMLGMVAFNRWSSFLPYRTVWAVLGLVAWFAVLLDLVRRVDRRRRIAEQPLVEFAVHEW